VTNSTKNTDNQKSITKLLQTVVYTTYFSTNSQQQYSKTTIRNIFSLSSHQCSNTKAKHPSSVRWPFPQINLCAL